MGKGLVSGVCLNAAKDSVVLVFDIDPARAYREAYGLPGGTIEDKEIDKEKAMVREWREEADSEYVGNPKFVYSHQRKGRGEFFTQFFFLIDPPKGPLRTKGVPGETGPPEWILLEVIFSEKKKLHWTHKEGLKNVLQQMALEDPDVAFMIERLRII
ncbi:MAG: NUDIX hydrolase [Patescibacteria group bacterium]